MASIEIDSGPAEASDRQLLGLGRPRPSESQESFVARFTLEIERALKRSNDQDSALPEDPSGDDYPLFPTDESKE